MRSARRCWSRLGRAAPWRRRPPECAGCRRVSLRVRLRRSGGTARASQRRCSLRARSASRGRCLPAGPRGRWTSGGSRCSSPARARSPRSQRPQQSPRRPRPRQELSRLSLRQPKRPSRPIRLAVTTSQVSGTEYERRPPVRPIVATPMAGVAAADMAEHAEPEPEPEPEPEAAEARDRKRRRRHCGAEP